VSTPNAALPTDAETTPHPLHFEPSADNTRALRDAFGCFGTGVTIITTQTADGPLGMTANSFSSISLDPALVLWSPALSSKRHDAFAHASTFCIHVLSQQQLDLAKHFATNGSDFSPVQWTLGPGGAPRLKGCLAEFHCDTFAIHPAGDHSLILGHIRDVFHDKTGGDGLLFDKGRFGGFSPL
jgi:flavin reductase (DIM6/NTAB) family NADH-FMN oxidoreductase RutF